MNLADNIKKIRKENNLSQEQLAEKLGVSRQSVSKWESGQAYPEMDKVLQICELFNLNMDELMKSDLKEVRESRQSKANINKYVDDFFNFVTKTIDMFGALNFKDKIRCLIEQGFIALILFLAFFIFGAFASEVFRKIFAFINGEAYWVLLNIFEAIYLIIATILFLAIFFHIFKIRYLDYYVVVKEENANNKISFSETKDDNLLNEEVKDEHFVKPSNKKPERVIIRDPKHSEYRFLSGLLKCALFFIKFIGFFIGVAFIFALLGLSFSLVIPFLFINAKHLFWGFIITVVSCIIINLVILKLILNFLINKKSSKSFLGTIVALSVIFLGIGGGIFAAGLTNVKYESELNKEELVTESFTIEMNSNLVIDNNASKITYIESDNENVVLEVEYSKYLTINLYEYSKSSVGVYVYPSDYEIFGLIKAYLQDLNNYKIVDREITNMKIYTSKHNIEILKNNKEKITNVELNCEREMLSLHNYYENKLNEYELEIANLYERIHELEFKEQ